MVDSPVRLYIRYLTIDRSNYPAEFVPYWNVCPLYSGASSLGVRWIAGNIRHPTALRWTTLDSAETELFADIAEPLLAEMRLVDTPEAPIVLQRFDNPAHLRCHNDLEIPHRLIAGDFERVRELLVNPRRWTWHDWRPWLEGIGVLDTIIAKGAVISASGRRKIAEYFHAR